MVEKKFIRVLLPLSLDWVPTYSTTEDTERGQVVSVVFCRKRYLGIVWETDVTPDIKPSRIRDVSSVERDIPAVSPYELRLWEFIADYYLCSVGEVCKLSYPSFRARGEKVAASRIERLRTRLAALDEKISLRRSSQSRRLNAGVTERLEQERASLLDLIERHESPDKCPVAKSRAGKVRLLSGYARAERYIAELQACLDAGGQALVLCPDLAFCHRMERVLGPAFDGSLFVVHSEKGQAQRFRAAEVLRDGEATVILGTKNSIFLPFSNLSLIIVDEEQDSAYKNNESSPRFNARDCAVYMGALHNAQVLLGSAAPSLESHYNCLQGKYVCEELAGPPAAFTAIVDVNAEFRKRGMLGAFSRKMTGAIENCTGTVVIVRGWEKQEEIEAFVAGHFPSRDIRVMTLRELKISSVKPGLIAVLQADALLEKDDFRADEKALQLAAVLNGFAPQVLIQTAVPSRFDGSRSYKALLEERKEFGFPPFTRLVEVCKTGENSVTARHFLKRDADLARAKARIAAALSPEQYINVDPA